MLLTPVGNCDPGPSVFFADTLGLRAAGALALLALAAALYYRARARRARGGAALTEGPAAVHGRVVPADDAPPGRAPVTIRWTGPFVPQVDLQPLYVLLESGERVRVEPPRAVEWTEGLEDAEPLIRAAFAGSEIRPGAAVTLYGTLRAAPDPRGNGGGYRDAARAWQLCPNERGVLLFSLRAPGAPEARLASFHTRWAVAVLLGVLALQCTAFLNFNALRAFGTRVDLPVANARVNDERTDHGSRARDYVEVDYAAPDGRTYRLGYQTRGWDDAASTGRAPWLVVPALPRAFHQIGTEPTVPVWGALAAGVLVAFAFGLYLISAVQRLGWYRAQRALLARWTAP